MSERELNLVRPAIAKRCAPPSRYMAPSEVLEPWLLETNIRGCPFLNMAAEIPAISHPARRVGAMFYQHQRAIVA